MELANRSNRLRLNAIDAVQRGTGGYLKAASMLRI